MPEFARITTFEAEPAKVDQAIRFFNDTDLAGASSEKGFRRGFWLLDRSTGKGAEVVVFDSRDSLESSSGGESEAQGSADAAGIRFGSTEVYEVVAEGRPAS